ncbi:MAG: InlB B-repeat-containing protein, partial [Parasporobacterium sp.]|nr:InlB B-repeat-containing protein [Parasporobacterium sp.]
MKKLFIKLSAVILSVSMILALTPGVLMAEEEWADVPDEYSEEEYYEEEYSDDGYYEDTDYADPAPEEYYEEPAAASIIDINGYQYSDLTSAFYNAQDNDVLRLLMDVDIANPVTVSVPYGGTVTLDLNGYQIRLRDPSEYVDPDYSGAGSTGEGGMLQLSSGTLTIYDSQDYEGNYSYGGITSTNSSRPMFRITEDDSYGTHLNIQGGKYDASNSNYIELQDAYGNRIDESSLQNVDGQYLSLGITGGSFYTPISQSYLSYGYTQTLQSDNTYKVEPGIPEDYVDPYAEPEPYVEPQPEYTEPTVYTVYYDAGDGSGATSVPVNAYDYASEPSYVERPGYSFIGWYWYDESGALVPYDFSTPVTSDLTLYAQWTPVQYTVSYDLNTGDGSDPMVQYVNYGDYAPQPDISRDGYTFLGWYLNGEPYYFDSTVSSDLYLVAQWDKVAQNFTAYFYLNGIGEDYSVAVTEGDYVPQPENPYADGYSFDGWFLDPDFTTPYYFDSPAESDLSIYAKWTPVQYTVSYDLNTGDGSAPTVQSVNYGDYAPQPDISRDGYTFLGWYLNGEPYYFDSPVYSDLYLTAQWERILQNFTAYFYLNGVGEDYSVPVTEGDYVPQPENPYADGYSFDGWFLDPDFTTPYYFDSPAGSDLSIYAKWTPVQFTVSYDLNTGDGSEPTVQTVNYGDYAQQPDISREGYTFLGWYLNGEPYYFDSPVYSDLYLTAQWERILQNFTAYFYLNGVG